MKRSAIKGGTGGTGILIAMGVRLMAVALVLAITFHGAGSPVQGKNLTTSPTIDSERWHQQSQNPRYFWGRFSSFTPIPTGVNSAGSALRPADLTLEQAAAQRIDALLQLDPANGSPIPEELITATHDRAEALVSLQAVLYQAPRVARQRQIDLAALTKFVYAHVMHTTDGNGVRLDLVDLWALNWDLDRYYNF
jgi:K+-transporting ATPase ATPase C chain